MSDDDEYPTLNDSTGAVIKLVGELTRERDALKARVAELEAEEAEIRAMALAAKLRVAQLEAEQTRWVKCSERTPLTPGYYIVAVSENSTGPATALAHWSVGAQLWTSYYSDAVVAWLENVPEYVP